MLVYFETAKPNSILKDIQQHLASPPNATIDLSYKKITKVHLNQSKIIKTKNPSLYGVKLVTVKHKLVHLACRMLMMNCFEL